jgi:molybdenum cofactor cytidylyltransferase
MIGLGGETLIRRAVRIAMAAKLAPIIVVVEQNAHFAVELRELGCLVVVNEGAEEGIASSIRRGVTVARMLNVAGIILMTCDQVALKAEHLLALLANPGRVTGSRYAGKVGIPAYFPSTAFAALLELKGDVGARAMLQDAAAIENEDLALDVDTEADLLAVRQQFDL